MAFPLISPAQAGCPVPRAIAPRLDESSCTEIKAKPEQIKQVAAAIKLAKRPVIYAGGGVISGGGSLANIGWLYMHDAAAV